MLGIPTNPRFGSLNVAAAVQLIAYDWRMALGCDYDQGNNENTRQSELKM
jgi:tRNA C32,U32 (ribose-2'-O)-methylase TrmJ